MPIDGRRKLPCCTVLPERRGKQPDVTGIMFRTSSILPIKASLAVNGHSIDERDNAELKGA